MRKHALLNVLTIVLATLTILTGITWASRLLPHPWWIRVNVTLLRFHDRSLSFGTGGNFIFIALNHAQPPVTVPAPTNGAAVRQFNRRYMQDLGGRIADSLGLRLFRTPQIQVAPNGMLQLVGTQTSFGIGFGYPLVFFAILPLWRLVALWRKRRNGTPGHCRSCGYDLRGTPSRCPECGAPADGVNRLILARNLQSLRTSRQLSAAQVALRAKLSQAFVETVERGERNIAIDNIEKLARALNVSAAELLTKAGDATEVRILVAETAVKR